MKSLALEVTVLESVNCPWYRIKVNARLSLSLNEFQGVVWHFLYTLPGYYHLCPIAARVHHHTMERLKWEAVVISDVRKANSFEHGRIIFFIVYLTTLSVTQIIRRRLVNSGLGRIRKEVAVV